MTYAVGLVCIAMLTAVAAQPALRAARTDPTSVLADGEDVESKVKPSDGDATAGHGPASPPRRLLRDPWGYKLVSW